MSNVLQHIAFIMDGNGRWAQKRNLPRIDGHKKGLEQISLIIDGCIQHQIKYISFFCFSTENWNRPKKEVQFLIKLIHNALSEKNFNWFKERQIKVQLIGFEKKMPTIPYKDIKRFCERTNNFHKVCVNFYFNYGSQQEILYACEQLKKRNLMVNKSNFEKCLLTHNLPDVDLLIRTSGEERISNFLLWQIAYAEIIFEKTLWPDYSIKKLNQNIIQYNKRNRRFGKIKNE